MRAVPRVYIHEVVEVDGTRRVDYQHHMTANWVPEGGPLRRQKCFGVFTLVGSTGPWPRVLNLWEYGSWDDLAHNFSVELDVPRHRDPMLEQWWREAAAFRTGGFDRILVAHRDSPGIDHWQDRGGTGAVAYVHEVVQGPAGSAPDLCDEMAGPRARTLERAGLSLVGAWRTAMSADDEAIALWGVPDWPTWAQVERAAAEGGAFGLSAATTTEVRLRTRWLLVDAELSPLRIGRQPTAEDRRPLG